MIDRVGPLYIGDAVRSWSDCLSFELIAVLRQESKARFEDCLRDPVRRRHRADRTGPETCVGPAGKGFREFPNFSFELEFTQESLYTRRSQQARGP